MLLDEKVLNVMGCSLEVQQFPDFRKLSIKRVFRDTILGSRVAPPGTLHCSDYNTFDGVTCIYARAILIRVPPAHRARMRKIDR